VSPPSHGRALDVEWNPRGRQARDCRHVIREHDEIHRGYEVEPGTFVLIHEEELTPLAPPPSKTIEVRRFVPEAQIEPVWYERPY
jgi:non-homologous end joining protein Ku